MVYRQFSSVTDEGELRIPLKKKRKKKEKNPSQECQLLPHLRKRSSYRCVAHHYKCATAILLTVTAADFSQSEEPPFRLPGCQTGPAYQAQLPAQTAAGNWQAEALQLTARELELRRLSRQTCLQAASIHSTATGMEQHMLAARLDLTWEPITDRAKNNKASAGWLTPRDTVGHQYPFRS